MTTATDDDPLYRRAMAILGVARMLAGALGPGAHRQGGRGRQAVTLCCYAWRSCW
jgi:hypothetical protein